MSEYENSNELPKEDPYTYYAGTPSTPSEYRYVPEPKTKKKKQPWLPAVGLALALLGYFWVFSISLMVIRPRRQPSRSTMGSFSIRCLARMALASSTQP